MLRRFHKECDFAGGDSPFYDKRCVMLERIGMTMAGLDCVVVYLFERDAEFLALLDPINPANGREIEVIEENWLLDPEALDTLRQVAADHPADNLYVVEETEEYLAVV